MEFVDISALAGAKTQMMQANATLLEHGATCSGAGTRIATAVRPPAQ
jgi:hypothetical protein